MWCWPWKNKTKLLEQNGMVCNSVTTDCRRFLCRDQSKFWLDQTSVLPTGSHYKTQCFSVTTSFNSFCLFFFQQVWIFLKSCNIPFFAPGLHRFPHFKHILHHFNFLTRYYISHSWLKWCDRGIAVMMEKEKFTAGGKESNLRITTINISSNWLSFLFSR